VKINGSFNPIMIPGKTPVLSLILCSRNDQYMGNSLWRLQTTLNYVAQKVQELSRYEEVEILVADWGSEIPLREVLEVNPAAASMVSFVVIPPEIARDLQKDSPFPEVLALNAAARRAGGEYIGRIDQDTLVGKRFLEYFFTLHEGRRQLDIPLNSALMYANQRMVPYRFTVRSPSLRAVDEYIDWFGRVLKIELSSKNLFYFHGVGIWLVHRDLWNECGGYDERMIYMNNMEINMIARLMKKYKMVNLGKLVNYDFYHLEHYHPLVIRSSSTYRKVNPESLFAKPDNLNPNGQGWGLVGYPFEKLPIIPEGHKVESETVHRTILERLIFIQMILLSAGQIAWDWLVNTFRRMKFIWCHRGHLVWNTVRGQRMSQWPRLIIELWMRKKSI
jgi:hypothetical protein